MVGSEFVDNSESNFELDINLYSINPDTVIHRSKENSAFMTLDKTSSTWNRLTPTKQNIKDRLAKMGRRDEENDTEEEDLLQNLMILKKHYRVNF